MCQCTVCVTETNCDDINILLAAALCSLHIKTWCLKCKHLIEWATNNSLYVSLLLVPLTDKYAFSYVL